MLHIFNMFLLLMYVLCDQQYDPTKNEHRDRMIFLEELVRHCIQKGNKITEFYGMLKEKGLIIFKVQYNLNHKIIIIDRTLRIAYKIYIITDISIRNGDDLAKSIESKYLCKIYDLINTEILISRTYQKKNIKILAMELLDECLDSTTFYSNLEKLYHKEIKYKDKKLFYIEIVKPKLQRILKHVVMGAKEFHDREICMLGIRDQNLMYYRVDNKHYVKLIDFEFAVLIEEDKKVLIDGALGYAAPEFIQYHIVYKFSDIWSIGFLAYSLITGDTFFKNYKFEYKRYNEFIVNVHYHLNRIIACTELREFILACLVVDFSKRPTADQLLNYAFLKNFDAS
ncbi:Stk17bp [Conglomerata obtusa]